MITELHIKNIGIIDDLSLNLNDGFNVLTGETGAGKTLIIDSLSIIAGGRFSKEMIRKGQEYSFVEICLYLPKNEKSIDGNVIISREIYLNGRNLCKINGRLVTVTELKEFMKDIIDIHGQHDNQNLLNKNVHIEYLDDFSGDELLKLKKEYSNLYQKYNELNLELKKNYGDEQQKQRTLDLLKYQLNEIEIAKLQDLEDEELEEQRKIFLNFSKISESLKEADIQIGDNTLDSINLGIKNLEKIQELNLKYQKALNSLKSIYYDLEEVARDINDLRNDICFDEFRKKEIDNRLDLIYSLKRKYGNNIKEILNYKEKIKKEIQEIENLEEYTKRVKEDIKEIENKMYKISMEMHGMREKSSIELANNINIELQELEMKNAIFNIKINNIENREFNKNGLDEVEFLISTNIGEEEKSLVRIASGGEIARIMLAIKTVLSNIDKIPVLIFDEIDIGISGVAANKVGEKLKLISKNHQVLIVTHLASIAAKGKHNYYIYKQTEDGKTKTKIEKLDEEKVLKEIARISSGFVTEISLKHAIELRKTV